MYAFGINYYFIDKWHYLDATVSAVSLLEMLLPIIDAVLIGVGFSALPESSGLDTFMSTLVIVRVLRPLKVFTMIPSLLEFLEACTRSVMSVIINFSFLLFAISALSVITNYMVSDSLAYRCYPDDLTDVNVWNNS